MVDDREDEPGNFTGIALLGLTRGWAFGKPAARGDCSDSSTFWTVHNILLLKEQKTPPVGGVLVIFFD